MSSDRCYVEVMLARKDLPRLEELGEPAIQAEGVAAKKPGADWVLARWPEVDYAGESSFSELAQEGIKFVGRHAAGANYGACLFVSDGKSAEYIPYDWEAEGLVVRVGLDAKPLQQDLKDVKRVATKMLALYKAWRVPPEHRFAQLRAS